jgi:pilus assembly protein CpaB
MARRIILLAIAVAVALFGAGAVLTYASSADSRALASQAPVQVLVATALIPAGTTAEQAEELVELTDVPKRIVPTAALKTLAPVAGQVLEQDVQAGEIIGKGRFVSEQVAGSLQIPGESMAMSVQVQDPQRVGGYVLPGSEVAIFDTFQVEKANPGPVGEPVVDARTRLLLPRVKVIAVGPTAFSTVGGQRPADEQGSAAPAGTEDPAAVLTLAVDADQAVRLAHAANTGRLYFALLSKTSLTGDTPAVDNRTLFN